MQVSEGTPKIHNLKIHFVIEKAVRSHLESRIEELKSTYRYKVKNHHNFVVFRGDIKDSFVFIIFPKSGFVNVTKLKGFEDISESVKFFCDLFHISRHSITSGIVIDNITATGSFQKSLNLQILKELCSDSAYNPNFFPGLFVRRSIGTIIVFHSGRYCLVGAKCMENLMDLYQEILVIIRKL